MAKDILKDILLKNKKDILKDISFCCEQYRETRYFAMNNAKRLMDL